MEKKLKTTSHDDDDEVDRISELPEHIIHHIMEFLPTHTVDVTRMSVLSKTFFSFWCSFPVLDFYAETILKKSKVRDTESVLNSIQYTFQHRRLSIKTCLQRLEFRGFWSVNNNCSTTRDVIHEMISFAVQKQVKQLHLSVGYSDQLVKLSCFPEPVLSTKSITILTLHGFSLEAQHPTLSLPLIEALRLSHCSGIKSIILSGEKLRRVDLLDCYELEKIQVDEPTNLDVLRYGGNNYCQINFASNKSVIRRLEIRDTIIIHDKWFNSGFCRFVENLKFCMCTFPVKTRWYFDSLKRLELDGCGECQVEFETPNLEWFKFRGYAWDIPLLISSPRFDAIIHPYKLNVPIFMDFRMPLKCQTLTLFCFCAENLIYPIAMRAGLNPQLHDTKHLKIECIFPKEPYNIVELIDSLLWFAPHPNTISFIDHKSQVVLKSIKFNYHDATSKNANCCRLVCGVECWPQCLKEVELHKFEDDDERTSLKTYIFNTYKTSIVINE